MLISRRLQHFSTTRVTVVVSGFSRSSVVSAFRRTVEQPNRGVERCRTQVHASLRRLEVLMPGEFLNGPSRRATHRQMRTERVTEDVDARFDTRAPGDPAHRDLDDLLRERLAPPRRRGRARCADAAPGFVPASSARSDLAHHGAHV